MTEGSAPGAGDIVHVIQSSYHYRDHDNYPMSEEKVVEDEGWFADIASAGIRCEQLNAQHRALYDVEMARAKRERDAKVRAAEATNREAAVLRANGLTKDDVPVPAAFTPIPFENWVPSHGYTRYEVIQIRRSDHDGIATASAASAVTGTDTAEAASGTA